MRHVLPVMSLFGVAMLCSAAPTFSPIAPSLGTGVAQVFSFPVNDSAGGSAVTSVMVFFSPTYPLSAPNGCHVDYVRSSNTLYIDNDGEDDWIANSIVGTGGKVIQNSQCSVDAGHSSASVSGTKLTLTLSITFTKTPSTYYMYEWASDASGQSDGGNWSYYGFWRASSYPAFPVRGGSDYATTDTTNTPSDGCASNDNPIVNYNSSLNSSFVATVNSQLAAMRGSAYGSQASIRVPIFYTSTAGRDSCTAMTNYDLIDASSGVMPATCQSNLLALLTEIKSAGYQQIEIGFFPQGQNSPTGWPTWPEGSGQYENLFQLDWNFIYNTRNAIAQDPSLAGPIYMFDLSNEATPSSTTSGLFEFSQRLYGNYNSVFGHSDTVGFSIADGASLQSTVATLPSLYGGNYPPALDFHTGGAANGGVGNAQGDIESLDTYLTQQGLTSTGLIIGEIAYTNSSALASQLSNAKAAIHRNIWWVTQWPIDQGTTPPQNAQNPADQCQWDSAIPASFVNYMAYGW